MRIYALQSLLQHSDPAAGTFVRKFLQFAVFLNRQTAVPIFGQLRLSIISSFASHAVLPLLRFVEEHTTLSASNPDGAGWALTLNIDNNPAERLNRGIAIILVDSFVSKLSTRPATDYAGIPHIFFMKTGNGKTIRSTPFPGWICLPERSSCGERGY